MKIRVCSGFLRSGRGAAYDVLVAPRISVLVPCYDDGATVAEAIASISEDEAVDLVLIDDGSRDPHTIAVLDDLAARGDVRLIRQANAGVAAALRAGTAAATAPYVFILNSDDLVEARALATLADALVAQLNRLLADSIPWRSFREVEGDKKA